MSKETITIPDEKLKLYDQLIAANPEVELKGKTMPYTSLNGHMFSFLDPSGIMGLRLSATDREAFLEEHQTQLMEQHGRMMKEYVAVPGTLLADTGKLSYYLRKSYDYILTLKPKATSRKPRK